MNITEFRQKYPQYDSIPDGELANKFYDKYYATKIPKNEFMQKFLGGSIPEQPSIAEAGIGAGKGTRIRQAPPKWKEYASRAAHTILPIGGAVGGTLVGAGAGGIGAPVGGTLGYAGGKSAARSFDEFTGLRVPLTLKEAATKTITEDIPEGMLAEVTGPAARAVGRGVAKITGVAGKYTGGLITGKGPGVVSEAYQAGKAGGEPQRAFLETLREGGSGKRVVKSFRDALQIIKDRRGAEYGGRLAKIEGASQGQQLDITPLNNTLKSIQNRFRIDDIVKTKHGYKIKGLTTLNKADKKEFAEILDMLDEWKAHPQGTSVLGLDSFKQQLDNFYTENRRIGAVATQIRNTVRNILNKNVPGYQEMTRQYSKTTGLISEAQHALSLKSKAASDTVLRKIFTGIKEDKAFRRELMGALQDESGKQLLPEAAGATMEAWLPEGLIGRGLGATQLMTVGHGIASGDMTLPLVNLGLLGISSPRVASEVARGLGATSRVAKQAIPYNKQAFDLGALIMAIMEMEKRDRANRQYPLTAGEQPLEMTER